jgi:hypothetical protein
MRPDADRSPSDNAAPIASAGGRANDSHGEIAGSTCGISGFQAAKPPTDCLQDEASLGWHTFQLHLATMSVGWNTARVAPTSHIARSPPADSSTGYDAGQAVADGTSAGPPAATRSAGYCRDQYLAIACIALIPKAELGTFPNLCRQEMELVIIEFKFNQPRASPDFQGQRVEAGTVQFERASAGSCCRENLLTCAQIRHVASGVIGLGHLS